MQENDGLWSRGNDKDSFGIVSMTAMGRRWEWKIMGSKDDPKHIWGKGNFPVLDACG